MPLPQPPRPHVAQCRRDLSDEDFAHFLAQPLLALDLETQGLQPHRDRICLVQIASTQRLRVIAIDADQCALATTNGAPKRPERLTRLLEAQPPVKIFHFAPFDVTFLTFQFACAPVNAACTKALSRMTRTYTQEHGLKACVKEVFGVELDKSSQQTDWSRELSPTQLEYAVQDVIYLIPMYRHFRERLETQGRWPLAERALDFLPAWCRLHHFGWGRLFEYEGS